MTLGSEDRNALLAVFRPDARARVARLQLAMRSLSVDGDTAVPEHLVREAHTLRGSAATVGLEPAAALAGALEDAFAAKDVTRARELVDRLAAELGDVPASRTVLYIEDDPTNLLLVQRIAMRVAGVRLLSAPTGSEGVELARTELPDLILLDLALPDLPGDEILARLRADSATGRIPVVVVSASAQPARVGEFLRAGAAAYLTKPFDIDELAALLRGENEDA